MSHLSLFLRFFLTYIIITNDFSLLFFFKLQKSKIFWFPIGFKKTSNQYYIYFHHDHEYLASSSDLSSPFGSLGVNVTCSSFFPPSLIFHPAVVYEADNNISLLYSLEFPVPRLNHVYGLHLKSSETKSKVIHHKYYLRPIFFVLYSILRCPKILSYF